VLSFLPPCRRRQSEVPSCPTPSRDLTIIASHDLSTAADSVAETAAPNDDEYDVTPVPFNDDKFTRTSGDRRKSMETADVIRREKNITRKTLLQVCKRNID